MRYSTKIFYTAIVTLFLFGGVFCGVQSASAADSKELPRKKEALNTLTPKVVGLAHQYGAANLDKKPVLLDQLIAYATERENILKDLMELDAKSALQFAISEESRKTFPSSAQDHIEKKVTDLRGTYELMVADDFVHGKADYKHKVRTADGEWYSLHFADTEQRPITPGAEVTLDGLNVGRDIAVEKILEKGGKS